MWGRSRHAFFSAGENLGSSRGLYRLCRLIRLTHIAKISAAKALLAAQLAKITRRGELRKAGARQMLLCGASICDNRPVLNLAGRRTSVLQMNKAFVREPDETSAAHCPGCGSLGVAVGTETLRAHLDADALRSLADAAFYCPFAKCEVGYFDQFEQTVAADRIRQPAYPKDPNAPMCNCFGFTVGDIEADIREGSPRRVRELLARSKSAEAHCLTASPDGRCCMAGVQRHYMRARGLA